MPGTYSCTRISTSSSNSATPATGWSSERLPCTCTQRHQCPIRGTQYQSAPISTSIRSYLWQHVPRKRLRGVGRLHRLPSVERARARHPKPRCTIGMTPNRVRRCTGLVCTCIKYTSAAAAGMDRSSPLMVSNSKGDHCSRSLELVTCMPVPIRHESVAISGHQSPHLQSVAISGRRRSSVAT